MTNPVKTAGKLLFILLIGGILVFSTGLLAFSQADTTAPVITAPFPVNLITTPTPNIGATVTDNVYIDAGTSTLSINNGPPVTGLNYDSASQNLALQWPVPLPDGLHTALMEVRDQAGNVSTMSWTFTVDTTPPVITRDPFGGKEVIDYSTNNVTEFIFYVSDANNIKAARFYINNELFPNTMLLNWQNGPIVFVSLYKNYNDGPLPLRLEMEDYAGNLTVKSWTVNIKGTPKIVPESPKGVTTNYTPVIQAYITDYMGVDPASVIMSIDGGPEINVGQYFNKAPNYNRLYYPVSTPFSPGNHTITLKAKCKSGHETVTTWGFSYDLTPPQLSSVNLVNYPSQGKSFTVNEGAYLEKGTALWLRINASEDLTNLSVKLNGNDTIVKKVTGQVWDINPLTMSDGLYTMAITMSDFGNNQTTSTLNFRVAEAPVISNENPPNLAKLPAPTISPGKITDRRGEVVLNTRRPTISAKITDGNSSLTADNIIFKLNGQVQPFSFDSLTGTLTHTPTSDLPDETVYTISLTAADQAGNTTNGEWKFYINTFPTMPWATDKTCVSCHPNNLNIHLPATPEEKVRYGTTCESCHGNNIRTIEQRCISCHKNQWHFTVYPAGSYHEVAFNDQTGIPTLTLDTLHRAESGSCASCHAKSINREHQLPGRTDTAGKPINCDTCHLSTSPTVVQAIYNNQTSCAACHSLGGNGHEAVHITKLDANCTKVCHTLSLTEEHMANPKTQKKKLDCDTCHASQDPKHVSAIANNRIECATCHGEAHNMLLALMPDTDIPILSSLQWTTPVPAKIWRGEVPANLESGYVLISSASETLKGSDVLAFYKAQMTNNKWTQTNTDPTDLNNYQLSFTKTSRQALVRFHSVAGIAGPLYRITIVYN